MSCTPLTEEMPMTNTPTGQQLSGIKFGIFEYEFGLNYTKKSENEKIYILGGVKC